MKAVLESRLYSNPFQKKIKYWTDRLYAYAKELIPAEEKETSALFVQTQMESVAEAQAREITIGDTLHFPDKYHFVLFNIDASWELNRISQELADIKDSLGSNSKVIICSDQYFDELVYRCEDFNYDGYLLNSDTPDELQKAVSTVLAGRFYISRGVICSYCMARRKEWYS